MDELADIEFAFWLSSFESCDTIFAAAFLTVFSAEFLVSTSFTGVSDGIMTEPGQFPLVLRAEVE